MTKANQKGLITEIQCQYDFSKYGIMLSQPIFPDSRYDFIADICGKLYRIQCKAAMIAEDNSFIKFKSHMTNIRQNTESFYGENDIDYFYTHYNGQGYLIPIGIGGKQEKVLRFSAKQNHSTILWAKDFTIEKILTQLGYDYSNNSWSNTVTKG